MAVETQGGEKIIMARLITAADFSSNRVDSFGFIPAWRENYNMHSKDCWDLAELDDLQYIPECGYRFWDEHPTQEEMEAVEWIATI